MTYRSSSFHSAPRTDIRGRILLVVDGTDLIGQFQVVAINRGLRDGIGNGTVLAIDRVGDRVRDTWGNGASFTRKSESFTSFAKPWKLPDERTALCSCSGHSTAWGYALILGATDTIRLNDIVHNP